MPPGQPFDAVLLTFTLLEFNEHEVVLQNAADQVAPGGLLILALPDVWRDALQCAHHGGTAEALLEGSVEIPKVDKFTGKAYPFHAHRPEKVIATILQRGFHLERLERGGPIGEAFLLTFRRRAEPVTAPELKSV